MKPVEFVICILILVSAIFVQHILLKSKISSQNEISENQNMFLNIAKEIITKTDELKEEHKEIEIKLKGIDKKPEGISIKGNIMSDKEYEKIISDYKGELNETSGIISIDFGYNEYINDDLANTLIKDITEKFLPFKDNVQIKISNKVLFIDKIPEDEKKILNILKYLVIFQELKAKIKTDLKFEDLTNDKIDFDKILENLFKMHISFKMKSINFKVMIDSILKSINEIHSDFIKKTIGTQLIFFNSIKTSKININFDGKVLKESLKKYLTNNSPKSYENSDINNYQSIKQYISNFIQKHGATEGIKKLNTDDIKINFALTKENIGFSLKVNLPGLTQFLKENILN